MRLQKHALICITRGSSSLQAENERSKSISVRQYQFDSFYDRILRMISTCTEGSQTHSGCSVRLNTCHFTPYSEPTHHNVIKWKYFPRYWPFVRGIHRSPVNSPHKGQWRRALMFYLICVWINGWVNNDEAGDLRRHRNPLWRHSNECIYHHIQMIKYKIV